MASLIKVDRMTLERTLANEIMPDSRVRFVTFLRSNVDGLCVVKDSQEESPAQLELHFVVATDPKDLTVKKLADVGRDFFGVKHKIGLSNATQRACLEELLSDPSKASEALEALAAAREEVLDRVRGYHDRWLAWAEEQGIVVNRAGQTFLSGWLLEGN